MLGFGWSKEYWSLVVYRTFQGIFNGNIGSLPSLVVAWASINLLPGVSKSIIAELTDPSNIGDAYALSPLAWSSGRTIG